MGRGAYSAVVKALTHVTQWLPVTYAQELTHETEALTGSW